MTRRKLTDRAIESALEETGGVELVAARLLSRRIGRTVTSQEVVDRIRASHHLREAAFHAEETILDYAEYHLRAAVRRGNLLDVCYLLEVTGRYPPPGVDRRGKADRSSFSQNRSPRATALDDPVKRARERAQARARAGLKTEDTPASE